MIEEYPPNEKLKQSPCCLFIFNNGRLLAEKNSDIVEYDIIFNTAQHEISDESSLQ